MFDKKKIVLRKHRLCSGSTMYWFEKSKTPEQHNYKAALKQLEDEIETASKSGFPMYDDPYIKAIESALKIAIELQSAKNTDGEAL